MKICDIGSMPDRQNEKAEPGARANDLACHASCLRTSHAKQGRGSSLTLAKNFMHPALAIGMVAALGALGGLANCAISGEFKLPHDDDSAKVWRPGWIGNVIVGVVAAIVVWGIYGPVASLEVGAAEPVKVTFSQLLSSVLVGISGGQILTLLSQRESEKYTRQRLTEALQEIQKGGTK